MGVPKFFRYISERYPCLSELVHEHQIPEFDNLYLDMNGIIHMCSHPDDFDPHFRITEEKIFSDIFHYIEVLFRMIKPQKLFFMAVDGVAPRAKMNQQRGRRFCSAREAETLESKAKERGEQLPKEARFDSNCITPGTVFMARLHEQLKYFVSNKISTDKLWQNCKIILSGHETPGEGEHKIMDYIRYMKSQPGYDANTRHCLYGLDADLIMLGLCTHEPHFSLLREEVRFGKKAKRKNIPEQIRFYLLHLSLMREYLELEFLPLKESLPFEYDMEKIIDDWVLMGFLVGNDFIPHLPNLHIINGALPILYNAYMKILPKLDGYINEAGQLNLNRFEKFMTALASIDLSNFSELLADLKYFHNKTGRKLNNKERRSYKPKQSEESLSSNCVSDSTKNSASTSHNNFFPDFNPRMEETRVANKELEALIKATNDMLALDEDDSPNSTEIKLLSDPEIIATVKTCDLVSASTEESSIESKTESSTNKDESTDQVSSTAELSSNDSKIELSTNKDEISEQEQVQVQNSTEELSAQTKFLEPSEANLEDLALDDIEFQLDEEDLMSPYLSESETDDELINAEFLQHKNDYYMNKLDYSQVTADVMRDQAEGYVRAIQWNLHYYYNGVCSWSWYYPHHYAPYISDIKDFTNLKLEYDLGTPFQPFEQLLAVLPAASKNLLPEVYQDLMVSETSPIIDYYPKDFRTDLNGKKQDWEAVVLIPFIIENLLLKAMAPCNLKLTEEEVKRNTHGPMLIYQYNSEDLGILKAPAYYPEITKNHAKVKSLSIEDIRVPIEKLVKGRYPGAVFDVYYTGFPTFKHLEYDGKLSKAKVRVFDMPSQNDNMIISIKPIKEEITVENLAIKLLGNSVHVHWPHLIEAQIFAISTKVNKYSQTQTPGKFKLEPNEETLFKSQKDGIISHFMEKYGIDVGDISILLHVRELIGVKFCYTQCGRVVNEKQWAFCESSYPIQAVVQELVVADTNTKKFETVQELFPLNSVCYMIGQPYYGAVGKVIDNVTLRSGRIKITVYPTEEPDLSQIFKFERDTRYMHGGLAARKLAISPHLLSRITGSIFASLGDGTTSSSKAKRINIGLNLKLNKKNEEVSGYTKKVDGQWLYSQKSVDLVRSYMNFCPELFSFISSNLGNDMFLESELFPNDVGNGRIQKIVDWFKSQPFSTAERRKVGSKVAEREIVERIEKLVDDFNLSKNYLKEVVLQVKPHLLYKPDIQSSNLVPDPDTTFELYDRVVNVRESYTVPFGCKGTVIGIQSSNTLDEMDDNNMNVMYDVIFDEPFAGGLQLNCSANRGYRLPKSALINISHGKRMLHQKTVNPVANNPWFNKAIQIQQPAFPTYPVQQPKSAFASWTPPPSYPGPPQQMMVPPPQQVFVPPPPQVLVPPPPQILMPRPQQMLMPQPPTPAFAFPTGHHQRLPAPNFVPNQPQSLPKKESNKEFEKFLQGIQKHISNEQTIPPKNQLVGVLHNTGSRNQDQSAQFNIARNIHNSPIKSTTQQKPQEITTETVFLKKMLNITGNESTTALPNKQSLVAENEKTNQGNSVQDFFARARKTDSNLAQLPAPNVPYHSVQLLNYCQAHRIGIPRYVYCPVGNKIRAQIILPDGRMVFGEDCATKEEAMENAARKIMNDIAQQNVNSASTKYNKQPFGTTSFAPKGFPIPPKQWCQTQEQRSTSNFKINGRNSPNGSKVQPNVPDVVKNENRPVGATAGATSFVPLQAVKQHRHKSSTNSSNVDQNKTNATGNNNSFIKSSHAGRSNSSPSNDTDANAHSQVLSKSKPQKAVKKSRIAANFPGLRSEK